MRRRKVFLVSGLLAIAGVATLLILTAAGTPLALPGINAKDPYPQGCVDCHTKDGNRLLPNMLKVSKNMKTGHPDIAALVKVVPTDCAKCHKEGGLARAINQDTHLTHFSNPQANAFLTDYQGQCLFCHTLDFKTGTMNVKTGPKNW